MLFDMLILSQKEMFSYHLYGNESFSPASALLAAFYLYLNWHPVHPISFHLSLVSKIAVTK